MIVGVHGDSVEEFRSVERIPTMIVCVHKERREVSFRGMNSYYDFLCTRNLEFHASAWTSRRNYYIFHELVHNG